MPVTLNDTAEFKRKRKQYERLYKGPGWCSLCADPPFEIYISDAVVISAYDVLVEPYWVGLLQRHLRDEHKLDFEKKDLIETWSADDGEEQLRLSLIRAATDRAFTKRDLGDERIITRAEEITTKKGHYGIVIDYTTVKPDLSPKTGRIWSHVFAIGTDADPKAEDHQTWVTNANSKFLRRLFRSLSEPVDVAQEISDILVRIVGLRFKASLMNPFER